VKHLAGRNSGGHMTRPSILVIPVNGIGNRLRAISSGLFLANKLRRDLHVLWEPVDLLPGKWDELFDNSSQVSFISREDAKLKGFLPAYDVPLYLGEDRSFVTLRGYDRGESPFAREFYLRLRRHDEKQAVIMAGNSFHPHAKTPERALSLLRESRRALQVKLCLSETVWQRVAEISPTESYLGLHLRGTDRAHDASPTQELLDAATKLAAKFQLSSIFMSSEDDDLLSHAKKALKERSLKTFYNLEKRPMDTTGGTLDAFSDFLALRGAKAFVGNSRSTFSTEASVSFKWWNTALLSPSQKTVLDSQSKN